MVMCVNIKRKQLKFTLFAILVVYNDIKFNCNDFKSYSYSTIDYCFRIKHYAQICKLLPIICKLYDAPILGEDYSYPMTVKL